MGAIKSEVEITPEMIAAGIDEKLIAEVTDEIAAWEAGGELYEEFARRLLVLFWKNLKK